MARLTVATGWRDGGGGLWLMGWRYERGAVRLFTPTALRGVPSLCFFFFFLTDLESATPPIRLQYLPGLGLGVGVGGGRDEVDIASSERPVRGICHFPKVQIRWQSDVDNWEKNPHETSWRRSQLQTANHRKSHMRKWSNFHNM